MHIVLMKSKKMKQCLVPPPFFFSQDFINIILCKRVIVAEAAERVMHFCARAGYKEELLEQKEPNHFLL